MAAPETIEVALRVVASIVVCYNQERLHSATDYLTPTDKPAGLEIVIFAERHRKLETVRGRCDSRTRRYPRHRALPRNTMTG